MSASNPQNLKCAAFETVTVEMSMSPATDVAGGTFQMNVRKKDGTSLLTVAGTVVDSTKGVVDFTLTSANTGTDVGIGAFDYDVWRTDAGNEKRLTYGDFQVTSEQWK